MTYKGLIFDFNGVLWWDTGIQEKAWREYASKLRGNEVSIEEMKLHMHGRPNKYFLEYLLGREITSSSELHDLIQGKESYYRSLCLALGADFKLSPGAIELLDYLKNNNIPRTIATASEISNVNFFIERLNLLNWFEKERLVYDDNSFPGKPQPDIYLLAADKLALEPADCIVIEDAVSGVQAAKAARIGKIYGLGPEANWKKLTEYGADELINSLLEFPYQNLFLN